MTNLSLASIFGAPVKRLKPILLGVFAIGVMFAAPQKAWATFGVVPHVDCVTFDEFTNQMVVYWGYTNTNNFEITIDNAFNFFVPGPGNRDQPITFPPGRRDYAFTTISDASTSVTWVLGEFFATATNDPNLYCTNLRAVGQPSIVPSPITIQAGAPATILTLATVISPIIDLSRFAVQTYGFPSAISLKNAAIGVSGVLTAQISADSTIEPGQYSGMLLVIDEDISSGANVIDAVASVPITVTAGCEGTAITEQPIAQFTSGGTSVSLTAEASGSPTPSVEWQVSTDGGSTFLGIPGATSSTLTVPYSAAIATYQYRAVFTNTCGTATTGDASIPAFNNCLRNDTNGDHIQFNSATGDYLFTHCGPGGFTFAGKGTVRAVNGTVTISDKRTDRVVTITFLQNQLIGGARLTLSSSAGVSTTYVINDSSPSATCACQ